MVIFDMESACTLLIMIFAAIENLFLIKNDLFRIFDVVGTEISFVEINKRILLLCCVVLHAGIF